jgi:formylglycine-generating enzyme required for sulfatase activity
VRFWGSEGEVPLGVADGRWKKNWLLLRQIPSTAGGTVVLGSPDYEIGREAASETQRTVRVTAPFYMGVYEVTQYQWERVGTRSAPSYWSSPTWRDERPVEMVSWYDIRSSANGGNAAGTDWPNDGHAVGPGSFMYVLRAKTGRVLEFDLPTDAQWEYACRAGTDGAWSNGTGSTNNNADANLNLLGRYQRNGGQINTTGSTWVDPDNTNALGSVAAVTTLNATAAVGSYLPNAWGLYDMHGNAFEWCLDWYVSGDTVLLSGDDPVGPPAGSSRVRRGGRWYSGASDCRSARRLSNVPSSRNYGLGFRVAAPAAVDMSAGQ